MDTKRRLDKLEADSGGELPFLIVTQDLEDKTLYRAVDGTEYHRADFDELEKTHRLVAIEYGTWPPGEPEPGKIQLKWPEELD